MSDGQIPYRGEADDLLLELARQHLYLTGPRDRGYRVRGWDAFKAALAGDGTPDVREREVARLRAALANLMAAHDGYRQGTGPCVCAAHEDARAALSSLVAPPRIAGDGTPGPAREAAPDLEALGEAMRDALSEALTGWPEGSLGRNQVMHLWTTTLKYAKAVSGDSGGPREAGEPWLSDVWRISQMRALPAEVQRDLERDVARLRAELGRAGTEPIKRESYRCPRCGSREWRGDVCEGCAFDRARADAERREPEGAT